MNRSEMVRAIAMSTSLSQKQAREAVDAFVDFAALAFNEGEDLTIAGFGRFVVHDRPETIRRNPSTGGSVVVPKRKGITFRVSNAFKKRIS